MSRHNNFPAGPLITPAPAVPPPPQLIVAPCLNDAHLIALVAAKIDRPTPRECVAAAVQLVAESVVATKEKAIEQAVKAIEEAG